MTNIKGFEAYSVTREGAVLGTRGKALKFDTTSAGYYRVTLCRDGLQKRTAVHRLVALHYLPNPSQLPCVNHINGSKTDNRVENLEWVSHSDNHIHAFATGLRPQADKAYQATVSSELIHKACAMIQAGAVRGEVLAACSGLKKHMFDNIRRRRTWKSISVNYLW